MVELYWKISTSAATRITRISVFPKYFLEISIEFWIVRTTVFSYLASSEKEQIIAMITRNTDTIPMISKMTGLFFTAPNSWKSRYTAYHATRKISPIGTPCLKFALYASKYDFAIQPSSSSANFNATDIAAVVDAPIVKTGRLPRIHKKFSFKISSTLLKKRYNGLSTLKNFICFPPISKCFPCTFLISHFISYL